MGGRSDFTWAWVISAGPSEITPLNVKEYRLAYEYLHPKNPRQDGRFAKSTDWLSVWERTGSNLNHVKTMIYKIDTCRYLA